MSDSTEENPLFAIEYDSSDESTPDTTERVPRDFQSEENFQTVRREWKARSESGEIHKTLPPLPLNPRSKPQTAQFLYAIEELYFYRKFEEAKKLSERILEQDDLMEDFRAVVEKYERRCGERLGVGREKEKEEEEK
ncbi:hypothetical protein ACHAO1_006453 [Botrytis cinerea]|uniref:Uncharacterized protein n=1 Tax=Botryotinia fuckeliana (strain T4) TaxID=999810 RepID=G2YHI0_BOTF4|nr:hypothetical protein BofuT4_P085290.1 [Botrytis cinerea T4]